MVNLVKDMAESMTVNVAYHSDGPNVGLALTKDIEKYKMYVCDTGLFVTPAFKDKKVTENIIYEALCHVFPVSFPTIRQSRGEACLFMSADLPLF